MEDFNDSKSFSTRKILILIIILYGFLKTLMYFTGRVFFDEGVYVGIANYFASGGSYGFFESIRPLLLPFLLIPFQYLPINPLISGRLFGFILTIGSILLVYSISKYHFGERAARWSALLFAASGSVVFFGGTILTDIIVFTLVLASASFAWRGKWFFAGCILGVSFLLKFPVLILCAPLLLLLIFRYKQKLLFPGIYFASGLLLFIAPYFIFNNIHYTGSLFERLFTPLLDAASILQNETWIYNKSSLWKYSLFLLVIELPIVLSFLFSLKTIKLKESRLFLFFILCLMSFLLYFSWHVVRLDFRYMLAIIPFLAVMGGVGLSRLVKKNPLRIVVLIVLIPLIISIVFLSMGQSRTTVDFFTSKDLVFTNAGQALLNVDGKVELYPGPNIGYFYKEWYTNPLAEWLILDLEGYPCPDDECKQNLNMQVSRLLTTNQIVDCGKLYGEDVIIISKHAEITISKEECVEKIRGGPYVDVDSKSYVRLSDAVITLEGRLQNLERLQRTIAKLEEYQISSVLVLVASESELDEENKQFIENLPENVELGVFPRKGVSTEEFITNFERYTGKKITVISSPSDDWIGQSQEFPQGIKSCVRGAWDQTIMIVPCKKMDLYIVKDWSAMTLHEGSELLKLFEAYSNIDYEVGVDIPVSVLNLENIDEIIRLIDYIGGT
jgi:hypothetical protein